MISIQISQIPDHLKNGFFYRALESQDNPSDRIEVPAKCFRLLENEASNIEDFTQMLHVMTFWGLDTIPQDAMEFCFRNELATWDGLAVEILGAQSSAYKTLKWAFSRPHRFFMQTAIQAEKPELVDFWLRTGEPDSMRCEHAITHASIYGRLELVEILCVQGYYQSEYAICAAAQYGHMHVLDYLFSNDFPWDDRALLFAARGGQVQCMIYLREKGLQWPDELTLEFSLSKNIARAKGMWEDGAEYNGDPVPWKEDPACMHTAANSYPACLQYACENGCPIHENAAIDMAADGNLDCLLLLYRFEAPWGVYACEAAARNGHLNCLQFLHDQGCEWNEEVCLGAAGTGHLTCLTYLHEQSCPWGEETTTAAAENNHLECLKYALEHGCPYADDLLLGVASSGDVSILKYLIEEQGFYMKEDGSMFEAAFLRANLQNVRYLMDIGCPFATYVFRRYPYLTNSNIADADLLDCTVYAMEHGWQGNEKLIEFVHQSDFPLYFTLGEDHDNVVYKRPLCQDYVHNNVIMENIGDEL